MAHKVPPPDFRYVWLTPAPGSLALAITAATAAMGTAGALLWGSAYSLSAGVLLGGAALAASALSIKGALRWRRAHGFGESGRTREAAMAIVPWGILVDPDTELRILRWPGVRRITVDVAHSLRGGTPTAVASVVTVDTGRERLAGRTWGAVGLEGLTVNLDAYAEEAARPVALDLEGLEAAGDGATEPVMDALLTRAGDLCSTGRGAVLLGLPPGGYRSMASRTAGPETVALLRGILDSSATGLPADARPLASIVAVLLGARQLVPDLLRLVSAPHPIVAAVAKAAALRLGAPQSRAGAVDEVAAFLFEEDQQRLEHWAVSAGCAPLYDGAASGPKPQGSCEPLTFLHADPRLRFTWRRHPRRVPRERAEQEQVDEAAQEALGRVLLHQEHLVVDGAHERVDQHHVIDVRRQLAARHGAGEHGPGPVLVLFAQRSDEIGDLGIGALGDEHADHALALRRGAPLHHVAPDGQEVGAQRARLGDHHLLTRDAAERLAHQLALGRPAPVDGRLVDAGAQRDLLDAEGPVAHPRQLLHGSREDALDHRLTANELGLRLPALGSVTGHGVALSVTHPTGSERSQLFVANNRNFLLRRAASGVTSNRNFLLP